jgi:hypothetical protein
MSQDVQSSKTTTKQHKCYAKSQRRNTTVRNGAELYRAHAEICHSVDVRVPLRGSITVSSIHEQKQYKTPQKNTRIRQVRADIRRHTQIRQVRADTEIESWNCWEGSLGSGGGARRGTAQTRQHNATPSTHDETTQNQTTANDVTGTFFFIPPAQV